MSNMPISVWGVETSRRYLEAKDYRRRAREAIREMHRQVGPLRFSPRGSRGRGVLVAPSTDIVMRGCALRKPSAIFRMAREEVPRITSSLNGTYRPDNHVGETTPDGAVSGIPEINRRPSSDELANAHPSRR